MKRQGFTLVELLVLVVILVVVIIWAVPNLNMARNRALMQETMLNAHTLSMGLENLRVEVLKDDFVKMVNQLREISDLNQVNTPWLVPKFITPQKTQSAWGGRYIFEVDTKMGQVNIGVPGRTGLLEFSLKAEPLFYDLLRPEDFNRGLVFRDGKMVVGPQIITE